MDIKLSCVAIGAGIIGYVSKVGIVPPILLTGIQIVVARSLSKKISHSYTPYKGCADFTAHLLVGGALYLLAIKVGLIAIAILPAASLIVLVSLTCLKFPAVPQLSRKPQGTAGGPPLELKEDQVQTAVQWVIDRCKTISTPDMENSTLFNQFVSNFINLTKDYSGSRSPSDVAPLIKRLFCESSLAESVRVYVSYRLLNEYSLQIFQSRIQDKIRWNTLDAPGDGNCMLWSCVLSECLRQHEYTTLQLSSMTLTMRDELFLRVQKLRQDMANEFRKRIGNPEFQTLFALYVHNNETVKREVCPDKELSLEATETMISTYEKLIRQDGKWNGEFEVQMVAHSLKRPIVIYKDVCGKLNFSTIAGGEFFESSANDPIYLKHVSENHYQVLYYHPRQSSIFFRLFTFS